MQPLKGSQGSRPALPPREPECFPHDLCFIVLSLGTVLHGICHPIKLSQHSLVHSPQLFPELVANVACGVGPLPRFQRTLWEAESMHVTRPPWDLAHDRCSTNGEQTDLPPSCSASSCRPKQFLGRVCTKGSSTGAWADLRCRPCGTSGRTQESKKGQQ